MKRRGWLAIVFVGVMVVNGLLVFVPYLVCAEEQAVEEGNSGHQQAEENRKLTTGLINSLNGTESIVISDMTFYCSNATRFYNRNGTRVAASSLQVNDYVKFFAVDYKLEEVRLVSKKDVEEEQQLPLAVDGAEDKGPAQGQNRSQDTPVREDGGVWKN